MNLVSFAEKMQTDRIGTMGKTIFVHTMPIDATSGVLLRTKLPGTKINYEIPGYFKTQIQLVAREQGYAAGESLINRAVASMTMVDRQLGAIMIRHCRPNELPVPFQTSKGNLIEFSVDIDLVFSQ